MTGWKSIPNAGDEIMEVESEKRAAEVVKWRMEQQKKLEFEETAKIIEGKRMADREVYTQYRKRNLEKGIKFNSVFSKNESEARSILEERLKTSDPNHRVSIIVKTDVDGSLDAIKTCLDTYDEKEVELDIISTAVGEVTETDLKIAQDFDGIIYAYNIRVSDAVRKAANAIYGGVTIREFQVIYALIDDLKEEVNQKLPIQMEENEVGRAVVAKEFTYMDKKVAVNIAGCRVSQGALDKSKMFRVLRGKETLFEGNLHSLKHHKDEVDLIEQGKECGLRLSDSTINVMSGDTVICYELRPATRTTLWSPGF